ncbi:response regulator [Paracoccus aminophilus]|uniref:KDP operon transcriptional regulatory protein kdpE n=1 Tax=Paracoccus aminophilus JCM 7686 TaxID=1367847 RepID=S5Y0H1_PARAH|nr:response regulator [Paracoccus aminophilus]AGT11022.1 KDP operon transcriptional regulatory protein kdpE [Paracoccus aminophilus JCM 7686]
MAPEAIRILVIEDEAPIRRFLRVVLEGADFVIEEAARGREGITKAATVGADIILVDLGLPDLDGKEVIVAIREWSPVPILVLSVRSDEAEIIAALDAGADDYVTKPFATGELFARLRALSRRVAPAASSSATLQTGSLEIDLAQRLVRQNGEDIVLTRKEFDVLAMLARHAGRLLTHHDLLETVWGPAHREDIHYLRIVISHLREKLNDNALKPSLIMTEPGIGYRMSR